jgi:transglutaminase-like putative cysteine protease
MVRHVGSAVYASLAYRPDSTHVDSTVDDVLEARAGVCQDFAHVMITICRHFGVPARYVSGYLYTPDEERSNLGEPASDATHAWVETYLPGWGWFGFDPTHDKFVGDRHVRTAVGRDYADVPPSRGIYRGQTESRVEVAVEVKHLDEPPAYLTRSFETTGWVPPEEPQNIPEEPQPFEYYAQQMQQQQ